MAIQLGILAAGNMAEAIVGGVIGAGVLKAEQIMAADVSEERRGHFARRFGVKVVEGNQEVAKDARTLLLSVKPQQMAQVLGEIGAVTPAQTLVVSIAAGISTKFIEEKLGGATPWRVIRTMPNTPMLIGHGMVALARGRHATEQDARNARELFESSALVSDVAEEQLDAVTAVSGSGPAYFFFLVEQMIEAGKRLGLSPEQARLMAIRTAVGAAQMMAGTSEPPEELRKKVTSPGGTTQAAITHLQNHDWPTITINALEAAARRSRELGG